MSIVVALRTFVPAKLNDFTVIHLRPTHPYVLKIGFRMCIQRGEFHTPATWCCNVRQNAPIHKGHGDVPGAEVIIIMDRQRIATTTVGSDGKWSALLRATAAGGPHTITLSSGSNTIVMNDVMFGDVWICSGQSNMEFNMNQVILL